MHIKIQVYTVPIDQRFKKAKNCIHKILGTLNMLITSTKQSVNKFFIVVTSPFCSHILLLLDRGPGIEIKVLIEKGPIC
jgi:dipeptide/tripeptide permease